uniref:Uncharacterized protein n=1 Tax=Timema poppense TaxID=170557 RepID=A0A7R9DFA2_TIMPO|nr:unnamed protein product [Timema poppensis]
MLVSELTDSQGEDSDGILLGMDYDKLLGHADQTVRTTDILKGFLGFSIVYAASSLLLMCGTILASVSLYLWIVVFLAQRLWSGVNPDKMNVSITSQDTTTTPRNLKHGVDIVWSLREDEQHALYCFRNPGTPCAGIDPATPCAGIDPGTPCAGIDPGTPCAGIDPGTPCAGIDPGTPCAGIDPGTPCAGIDHWHPLCRDRPFRVTEDDHLPLET